MRNHSRWISFYNCISYETRISYFWPIAGIEILVLHLKISISFIPLIYFNVYKIISFL